jgi:hypothetical protein
MKDYCAYVAGQYDGNINGKDYPKVLLSESPPEVFRPFFTVNIQTGDITLKRNPEPLSGTKEGCLSFGLKYE